MKLFYSPSEKLLLSIKDPATIVLSSFLWNLAWNTYCRIDNKETNGARLTGKECRLMVHVSGLLQR